MKLPKIAMVIATGFALTASSVSAQTFLCIADQSTGFSYSQASRSWETKRFNVSDNRYIIRKSNRNPYLWEVNQFGKDEPFLPFSGCKDDFNDFGFLHCAGLGGELTFNRENGRYILYYMGQYAAYNPNSDVPDYRKDGGDTPFIEIGKCSKI